MLLQANDYAWLHEHMDCELQAGGSDQWGNITAGIDLIRRRAGASVHGLTVPLDHALGRREVRQERRRRALARSRAHVALRALPVLREPAGRRRRALPAAAHARARRGGPARRRRARPRARAPRRPATAGLGDVRADPRQAGGRRGGRGVRPGFTSAGELALGRAARGAHATRSRRRTPQVVGRDVVDLLVESSAGGEQGRGAPPDRRRRHLRQRRRSSPRAARSAATICCTAAT